jgi:hypothetical protein
MPTVKPIIEAIAKKKFIIFCNFKVLALMEIDGTAGGGDGDNCSGIRIVTSSDTFELIVFLKILLELKEVYFFKY